MPDNKKSRARSQRKHTFALVGMFYSISLSACALLCSLFKPSSACEQMASPLPILSTALLVSAHRQGNQLEERKAALRPTVPRDVVLYLAVSSVPRGDTKLHVESHVM